MTVGNPLGPNTSSLLNGCPSVTFAPSECDCQPAAKTSCEECVPSWGCVWANASLTIAWALAPVTQLNVITLDAGSACRLGNGFGGPNIPGTEAIWTVQRPSGPQEIYTAWALVPLNWYWSQCSIEGAGPAYMYLGGGILALCCCCAVCSACTKNRRRRRGAGAADSYYVVYREANQAAVPVGVPVR